MADIKEWFVNSNEVLKGMIGQSYLAGILKGNLSKSVVVLTDQRIYQRGTIFDRHVTGRFLRTKGSKIVELRTVSGTSFQDDKKIGVLIIGVIVMIASLLIGLIGYTSAPTSFMPRRVNPIVELMPLTFIVGAAWVVMYFLSRARYFVIEYSGGGMATKCDWYAEAEIYEFQKLVSQTLQEFHVQRPVG
jgi:hypothetical protein